jgi:hypothetical protein
MTIRREVADVSLVDNLHRPELGPSDHDFENFAADGVDSPPRRSCPVLLSPGAPRLLGRLKRRSSI